MADTDTNFDLVVIGGGSGGVRAARMAAARGAKVAIIEEYRLGGTCVIRGCVPKKFFVYAARFADEFELARSYGWSMSDIAFDWKTLKDNKDREITRLENIYGDLLEGAGVTSFHDRGTIEGPRAVRLKNADKVLNAETILIATGSHPYVPNIVGSELGMNSNDVFELSELPESILIQGAGYIAVEFASIFAGLGVKTHLVHRRDRLLRDFDADLGEGLEEGMRAHGVHFRFETDIERLEHAHHGVRAQFSDGGAHTYGGVLFATGRIPNTWGLGLENAGVELTGRGAIAVDAHSRSSVPSIYAVGDVTGRTELTPVAIREGMAFVETVYGGKPTAVDYSLIPTAVFSEPEIGAIGMTEEEAAKTHKDIDIYIARFRPMANTLSARSERMMLKLITLKDGGKVLGCHIMGPGAAEMIQLVAIPMAMGAGKADFDRAIAVHPTAAEELVTFRAPGYVYRGGKQLD